MTVAAILDRDRCCQQSKILGTTHWQGSFRPFKMQNSNAFSICVLSVSLTQKVSLFQPGDTPGTHHCDKTAVGGSLISTANVMPVRADLVEALTFIISRK